MATSTGSNSNSNPTSPSYSDRIASAGRDLSAKAADATEGVVDHAKTLRNAAYLMAEEARRAAQPALDVARETASRAGSQAENLADEAYQRGRSTVRYVGHQVEQQPLLGLAVAFGLGYVMSLLLHGRS
jgi:ElaB/YqjD/DUF883 family membrane-anchored ribosome-binding protein